VRASLKIIDHMSWRSIGSFAAGRGAFATAALKQLHHEPANQAPQPKIEWYA